MNAWKKNRLWIALALLVVLVGIVVASAGDDDGATGSIVPDEVDDFPHVSAGEIDALTIRRPGEDPEVVELTKVEGGWRLTAPVDAEAETTTVQAALDKIGDLEVKRIAARDPKNHERLEVTDDSGIHVTAKQDGQVLASFIIGTYGGGETMVRLEGQELVYAASGSMKFAFDKAPKDWRNRKISDVRASRVREITLEYGETTRRFVKNSEDEWVQPEGEEPVEEFSGAKVGSIVASVAQMRATDFGAPDLTPEAAGITEPAARVVIRYRAEAEGDGSDDGDGVEGAAGEGDGDEEPTDTAAEDTAPLEETVFLLGNPVDAEDGPRYLMVEGRDDIIYQVTDYYAGKMRPAVEDLQAAEDKEGEAEAPPAPGGPDLNVAGGSPDIPPEVMQKIQQQIQQQQLQVQ